MWGGGCRVGSNEGRRERGGGGGRERGGGERRPVLTAPAAAAPARWQRRVCRGDNNISCRLLTLAPRSLPLPAAHFHRLEPQICGRISMHNVQWTINCMKEHPTISAGVALAAFNRLSPVHSCLSILSNLFVQIIKCICPDFKMYLSRLSNIFVKISKCICLGEVSSRLI